MIELIPFIIFSSTLIATPGPAVLAIISGGLNYGFRKTVFFIFGILVGFIFNISLAGPPITFLFVGFPGSYLILGVAALFYTFYLAYKIATTPPLSEDVRAELRVAGHEDPQESLGRDLSLERRGKTKKNLTFVNGLTLSVLNPKAYLIPALVFAQFGDVFIGNETVRFFKIMITLLVIGTVSDFFWLLLSSTARKWITSEKIMRGINRTLALLLVIVVLWAFMI